MQPVRFQPSFRRDNGLWSLKLHDLPLPDDFPADEQILLNMPPGAFGGNHRHPRREAIVALNPGLHLVLDIDGEVRQFNMFSDDELLMWIMPPFVPHAVINHSNNAAAFYEVADGPQRDVEPVDLISRITR